MPCSVADEGEGRERAPSRLGSVVGSEFPGLFDHVPVLGGLWVGVQPLGLVVGDLRELESEENSMASALSAGLSYAGQEAAGGGVAGVLAVKEVSVDVRLGGELFVVLEPAHHGGEPLLRV